MPLFLGTAPSPTKAKLSQFYQNLRGRRRAWGDRAWRGHTDDTHRGCRHSWGLPWPWAPTGGAGGLTAQRYPAGAVLLEPRLLVRRGLLVAGLHRAPGLGKLLPLGQLL